MEAMCVINGNRSEQQVELINVATKVLKNFLQQLKNDGIPNFQKYPSP